MLYFTLEEGRGKYTGDSVAGPVKQRVSFKNVLSSHGLKIFCVEDQGSEAVRAV